MITLEAFYMGRDKTHADELTPEIEANAQFTVDKVNEFLEVAGFKSVSEVASGWRPSGINASTANAAKNSKHLSGQACDIRDGDRTLASYCADNLDALEQVGLWCEDFRWTPNWVHFQTVPPKSGKRIFIPSTAPAPDPNFPVTWA